MRTAILTFAKWHLRVRGMNLSNVLWANKAILLNAKFRVVRRFSEPGQAEAVGKQEVSMFSGLERKQVVQRRQRSVAWAWVKARSTMKDQTKTTHAKLTSSVLLSSDCTPGEEISNWRDSLAALSHRSLARQICDQFYDLSILAAWRERSAEVAAAERALSAALPSYFQEPAQAPARNLADGQTRQPASKARITTSVLPEQKPQRTAVLIPLRSKAA